MLLLLTAILLATLFFAGSQSAAISVKADPTATLISVGAANTSLDEGNFSIIWITDTQYLSESHPTYFDSLCRWIVNNVETYNVKMVVHTGDLVEDEWNTTQWANANHSMSILFDAGIPYCWNAGNHDYNETYWIGNQFSAFNPLAMAEKPYWVSDKFDGQNTAVTFTVSNKEFRIVNIANGANDTVLSWANDLLNARPESSAIVATHFYVNRTGSYEPWANNFRRLVLATHNNAFLTLSAHVFPLASSGIRTQVGGRHELVFNRQEKDNYMGAASLRILTFDVIKGVVDVRTFYLYSNTYLTDANNQFTLETAFRNDAASSEPEEIPELPTTAILALLVTLLVIVGIVKFRAKRRING
jgi:hypothetical protein